MKYCQRVDLSRLAVREQVRPLQRDSPCRPYRRTRNPDLKECDSLNIIDTPKVLTSTSKVIGTETGSSSFTKYLFRDLRLRT